MSTVLPASHSRAPGNRAITDNHSSLLSTLMAFNTGYSVMDIASAGSPLKGGCRGDKSLRGGPRASIVSLTRLRSLNLEWGYVTSRLLAWLVEGLAS